MGPAREGGRPLPDESRGVRHGANDAGVVADFVFESRDGEAGRHRDDEQVLTGGPGGRDGVEGGGHVMGLGAQEEHVGKAGDFRDGGCRSDLAFIHEIVEGGGKHIVGEEIRRGHRSGVNRAKGQRLSHASAADQAKLHGVSVELRKARFKPLPDKLGQVAMIPSQSGRFYL